MTSFRTLDLSRLDVREDAPLFNVFQVVVLSVLLAVVCGMASRAVGLGWGITLTLSWICAIAGTLSICFMAFAVSEVLDQAASETPSVANNDAFEDLVCQWDDDLDADARETVQRVLFGDRSNFRDQIVSDLEEALAKLDAVQSDTPLRAAS